MILLFFTSATIGRFDISPHPYLVSHGNEATLQPRVCPRGFWWEENTHTRTKKQKHKLFHSSRLARGLIAFELGGGRGWGEGESGPLLQLRLLLLRTVNIISSDVTLAAISIHYRRCAPLRTGDKRQGRQEFGRRGGGEFRRSRGAEKSREPTPPIKVLGVFFVFCPPGLPLSSLPRSHLWQPTQMRTMRMVTTKADAAAMAPSSSRLW